jgi:small GTP-binding protein
VNIPPSAIQKKICMLGDFAVGKTSLVRRFVEGRFDDRYLTTIGVKISRRTVLLSQKPVHLLLWDLSGSGEFIGVTTSYLQGASGALLVCDLTRSNTLRLLEAYARRLRDVNARVSIVLAGNKADLNERREVDDEMLADLAHDLQAQRFITSAKTGACVEEAFLALAKLILER